MHAIVYNARMTPEVQKEWIVALEAKRQLRVGTISLDEAKRRCARYIELVNEGGRRLSKVYGNSYKAVSVTGFLR